MRHRLGFESIRSKTEGCVCRLPEPPPITPLRARADCRASAILGLQMMLSGRDGWRSGKHPRPLSTVRSPSSAGYQASAIPEPDRRFAQKLKTLVVGIFALLHPRTLPAEQITQRTPNLPLMIWVVPRLKALLVCLLSLASRISLRADGVPVCLLSLDPPLVLPR